MFNPAMMDPALMSFFKQAGEAYQELQEAEAAGKLSKALAKYCGPTLPVQPSDPGFAARCYLYAAKGYATAHIDGQITMGEIKAALAETGVWPPGGAQDGAGQLYLAYSLGFLLGSELPEERQQKILEMLPMASRIAANPNAFAQQLGLTPEKIQEMARDPRVQAMLGKMGQG